MRGRAGDAQARQLDGRKAGQVSVGPWLQTVFLGMLAAVAIAVAIGVIALRSISEQEKEKDKKA